MKLHEVRQKYLDFFKEHGHVVIPSARLVPENDPTTLFTGSGMQPLVPYLLGKDHPEGNRLVNSQKCFRSGDIDDIGDNRHTTFFEMLGNWSLGDYFKAEQLPWFFAFLTDEVGLDPKRLYVTAFIGDIENNIPKDNEAAEIWQKIFKGVGIDAKIVEIGSEERGGEIGMQDGHIFYYDAKKNWWSRSGVPANMPIGEPGGPDSEVFYEFENVSHDTKYGLHCHPNCDCGRFMEIGNSVFMEYKKNTDGTFSKLPQQNVDFGGGLERITAASEGNSDMFRIDVLAHIISSLEQSSGKKYDPANARSFRIIADHLRAAVFLIGDGVNPSNTDQGYFVRRLIRRAVRNADVIGAKNSLHEFVDPLLDYYKEAYSDTFNKKEVIKTEIKSEEEKFRKTLSSGLKEFEKFAKKGRVSGADAFILFSTYGFPVEITIELGKEQGIDVDLESFREEMKKHQDLSRAGSEQKFKGGLADHGDQVVKYHTATHLLHQALRDVLGDTVEQRGSNITSERLRFDFSFAQKMTEEEKKQVEDIVNSKIKQGLNVSYNTLPRQEAEKIGARHFFGEKYGETVNVYYIGDSLDSAYSKEFCGGPHVSNTGVLACETDSEGNTRDGLVFKIKKEEAISAGTRRIKAVLE